MSKKLSSILIVIFIIMVGLWIWTLAIPKNSIILGGSTSVNPVMQIITTEYENEKGVDFIYNSTGSQAGVVGVTNGTYAAGFISKEADKDTLTSTGKSWGQLEDNCSSKQDGVELTSCITKDLENTVKGKKDFYQFEFGIDALIVFYNAPDNWTDDMTDAFNFVTQDGGNGLGMDIMQDIYSENYTWHDMAQDLSDIDSNITPEAVSKIPYETILPISREDGSGTRTAFSDITGVKDFSKANIVSSNGQMLSQVQSNKGSFGYISYSFLESISGNLKSVSIDGINLKKDHDESQGIEVDKAEEEIKNGDYKLQRPFIAIFNGVSKNVDELFKLFEWITEDDGKAALDQEGIIPKFVLKGEPS